MNLKSNLFIPVSLIILFFSSCTPEELNTSGFVIDDLSPEYAVPIVNSDLTLDNIVSNSENGYIRKYNDGFVSLMYRGSMSSQTAEELIKINNQNYIKTITLNSTQANALMNGQQQVIDLQTIQAFDAGSIEIDSIWLKAGTFASQITSTIKTGGSLKVIIADAKKNGNTLIADIPFTYNGSIPVNEAKYLPLVGHHWDMSTGIQGYNEIRINYTLVLNPTTETINAGDEMQISTSFQGINFSRLYGYIGKIDLLDIRDTIDLSIFDNSKTGQFSIDDAIIKIKSGNSFGAEISSGFTKLEGYTKGAGNYNITNPPNPMPFNMPTINNIGIMAYDSAQIDKSNSNVPQVINQKPKQLIYQAFIKLNPNGKTMRNYIADKSKIKLDIEIELPLYGTVKNLVMESESEAELEMPENDDFIENLMIRFIAKNGFPIDLSTQVYLVDSFNVVFDSLFTDLSYKFLESAQVGVDGKVSAPTSKTTDIMLTNERAKRLGRLKNIRIRAEVATLNNGGLYPSVKLYANYVLGIKIGIKTKLNIKLKEL
ncbi:MAG: hypothetical protein HUU47_04750 [Bacteroidetes bacterium]|nr:hypothetical protein [Bacteroidota bacterium]